MTSAWYLVDPGGEDGPFTSSQLKALADVGSVTPDTLVRRDDRDDPTPARRIRGLFPDEAEEDEAAGGAAGPRGPSEPDSDEEARGGPSAGVRVLATSTGARRSGRGERPGGRGRRARGLDQSPERRRVLRTLQRGMWWSKALLAFALLGTLFALVIAVTDRQVDTAVVATIALVAVVVQFVLLGGVGRGSLVAGVVLVVLGVADLVLAIVTSESWTPPPPAFFVSTLRVLAFGMVALAAFRLQRLDHAGETGPTSGEPRGEARWYVLGGAVVALFAAALWLPDPPGPAVLAADGLSTQDRAAIRATGALWPSESLELVYASDRSAPLDDGLGLTEGRLVTWWREDGILETGCLGYEDIRRVELKASVADLAAPFLRLQLADGDRVDLPLPEEGDDGRVLASALRAKVREHQ